MPRSLLAAGLAVLLALAFAPDADAQFANVVLNGDWGGGGTVATGTDLDICLEGPAFWPVVLLVSMQPGEIPTQYGTLGLGSIDMMVAVTMNSSCDICIPCWVPCNPAFDGLTAYFQMVTWNPNDPEEFALSDVATITVQHTGLCGQTMVTYTQGGWGTKCSGNNPGCLRDAWFDDVFGPDGITIGDPDGLDGDDVRTLRLTSSYRVRKLLPNGGTPGPLEDDEYNPGSSSGGVLAGQLVAATLNVAFDDFGVFDGLKTDPTVKLGDLEFLGGVHAELVGAKVRDVLDMANAVISGAIAPPGTLDYSDISDALSVLNENFVEGDTDEGHLGLAP